VFGNWSIQVVRDTGNTSRDKSRSPSHGEYDWRRSVERGEFARDIDCRVAASHDDNRPLDVCGAVVVTGVEKLTPEVAQSRPSGKVRNPMSAGRNNDNPSAALACGVAERP
jgi:hypothetical protein